MTKRRRCKYATKLSDNEIIRLMKGGVYKVCVEKGTLYNSRGKEVKPFETNNRLYVRLYFDGDFKRIVPVNRLVWMWVTRRPIPRGFEVHHRDQNTKNNNWDNLYALYHLDHRKLHSRDLIDDPVPF